MNDIPAAMQDLLTKHGFTPSNALGCYWVRSVPGSLAVYSYQSAVTEAERLERREQEQRGGE